jgi:hypothetical protein
MYFAQRRDGGILIGIPELLWFASATKWECSTQ